MDTASSPNESLYRVRVEVVGDEQAKKVLTDLQAHFGKGQTAIAFKITGVSDKALGNLRQMLPMLSAMRGTLGSNFTFNASIGLRLNGLTQRNLSNISALAAAAPQLRILQSIGAAGAVNIDIRVRVPSASQIQNLNQLPPILQRIRAAIGNSPLIVNIQARGAAQAASSIRSVGTAAAQVSPQLQAMERMYTRTFSRIEFLATAFIANFVTTILTQSVQEVAKVDGAMRGLQVNMTRAGLSGREFFNIMRDPTESLSGFRFGIAKTTDALNKLIIGGLRPSMAELRKMKDMSVGAAVLFGGSPDKMFNDLATAALRVSYRIADNLGILVRPMQAYEKYAAKLSAQTGMKIDPKMLTAQQKSQAFFEAMMNSPGGNMLVTAAALPSDVKTLQALTNQSEQLRLAFGKLLLEGIRPVMGGLANLTPAEIRAGAEFVVLATKIGIAIAAFQTLRSLPMKAWFMELAASQQAYMTASRAGAVNGMFTPVTPGRPGPAGRTRGGGFAGSPVGGMLAAGLGMAGIALVVASLDEYQKSLIKVQNIQQEVVTTGVQFEQFLASINIGFKDLAASGPEATKALAEFATLGAAGKGAAATATKTLNFATELEAMRKELGLSDDMTHKFQGSIEDLRTKGIEKFRDAVIEAAKENKNFIGSEEQISAIGRMTLLPFIADATKEYGLVRAEQAKQTVEGIDNWDKFTRFVTEKGAGALDSLAQVGMGLFNIIHLSVASVAAAVSALAAGALGTVETMINGAIDSYNKFAGLMNASKPALAATLGTMGPIGAGIGAALNAAPSLPTFGHININRGGMAVGNDVFNFLGGNNAVKNLGGLGAGFAGAPDSKFGFGLLDRMSQRDDKGMNDSQKITRDLLRRMQGAGFLASPPEDTAGDGTKKKLKKQSEWEALGLTQEQYKNLQTIVSTGVSRGASEKMIISAIETGIVESQLRNLKYGDRDSVGVFQQRPSQGWGSRMQILGSVQYQAEQFYKHAEGGRAWNGKSFDLDTIGTGNLAQAVQGSKYPGKYLKQEGRAKQLLDAILSGGDLNFPEAKESTAMKAFDKYQQEIAELNAKLGLEQKFQQLTGIKDQKAIADIIEQRGKTQLGFAAEVLSKPDFLAELAGKVDPQQLLGFYGHDVKLSTKMNAQVQQEDLMAGYRSEIRGMKQTDDFLRQFGMAVDTGKSQQELLNEAIKIITDKTLTAANKNVLLNEDPALRQAVKDMKDSLARQALFDYKANEIDFQGRLRQAKNVDPNIDRGIGFETLLQQAQLGMGQAAQLKPGTPEADAMFKTLRDTEIGLFDSIKGMQKSLTPQGQSFVNKIIDKFIPQLEEAAKRLDPGPTLYKNLKLAGDAVLGEAITTAQIMHAGIMSFAQNAVAAGAKLAAAAGIAVALGGAPALASAGIGGIASGAAGGSPATSIPGWDSAHAINLDALAAGGGTENFYTNTPGYATANPAYGGTVPYPSAGIGGIAAGAMGGGGVGIGGGSDPFSGTGGNYTEDQLAAMNKKPPKEHNLNIGTVINNYLGGVLGQSNPGNLGGNLLQGLPGLIGQLTQNPLLGGLIQFGFNAFNQKDQALPVKNDAVQVFVTNPQDFGPEYSAVRDKDELLFAKTQRQRFGNWTAAGAAARGG